MRDRICALLNPLKDEIADRRTWEYISRWVDWWLIPFGCGAEFAMHVVTALSDEEVPLQESMAQGFLGKHSGKDFLLAHVDIRLWGWIGGNTDGPLEVVVVVAAPPA
jgi:hypothetical protein